MRARLLLLATLAAGLLLGLPSVHATGIGPVNDNVIEANLGLPIGTLDAISAAQGPAGRWPNTNVTEGSYVRRTVWNWTPLNAWVIVSTRFLTNEHLWDLNPLSYDDFAFRANYPLNNFVPNGATYMQDTRSAFLFPAPGTGYAHGQPGFTNRVYFLPAFSRQTLAFGVVDVTDRIYDSGLRMNAVMIRGGAAWGIGAWNPGCVTENTYVLPEAEAAGVYPYMNVSTDLQTDPEYIFGLSTETISKLPSVLQQSIGDPYAWENYWDPMANPLSELTSHTNYLNEANPPEGHVTAATWSGMGQDLHWTTGYNWQEGMPPEPNSQLIFGPLQTGAHADNMNDFPSATQFNGIQFPAGAPSYTLQGNSIVLGGGVSNMSTNTQTIALDADLPSQVQFGGSGPITVSGTLSGTGGVVKVGPSVLQLVGHNTYTGGTTVSEGTVLGNTDGIQGNVVNNAAVVFDQTINGTYTGNMTGTGSVTKTGAGTVTTTGTLNTAGNLTISQGTWVSVGTSIIGGTTSVSPGATLDVASGVLRTAYWINPGTDIVRAGARAEIINDLTVGNTSMVSSFFDIFGEVTVGGTTLVNPGGTLTVQPGGVFTTTIWKNPGKDVVRGIANITQDLTVGGPGVVDSFFDIFGEVTVGGTTTVNPGSQLTVNPGGRFTTRRWSNPGTDKVLATAVATITEDLTIPSGGVFETAGTVTVGGTTQVDPGATLTVQSGGFLRTGWWRNPGTDIIRLGGRAEIINDLTVGNTSMVSSFFDIFGEVTVGGTTLVNPGGTLTVQPGGVFTTTNWRNPGKDIVRGIANITQDLTVGGPGVVDSFFDIFTEVTVGGTTTVNPGSTLTVYDGGRFTTRRWSNPGTDKVLAGALATITEDLTIPAGGLFQAAGNVSVGGTVQVDPGATLEVQSGGFLRTGWWRNPGTDIVRAGGRAEIINDLTVGNESMVSSFFDVFGEVTVGGTTLVNPGGTLTVQPGGVFTTTIWRNPGKDVVRGVANITQDLTVGGPGVVDSFFDIFGEVTVGGTTTVNPGSQLTVNPGGRFTTRRWSNPGTDKVLATAVATITEDLTIPGGGVFETAGTVTVGNITQVDPGATLTVRSGGLLRTGWWKNPGRDTVLAGGRAEIINDLTVGNESMVSSFFDVFGEVTVGGTTLVNPGGTLTVQPGGTFTTTNWRNPGKDIVRGIANITQDLTVGGVAGVDSFFDIFTEVTVGGTTTVNPGSTLTVYDGGRFTTRRWSNPGKDVVQAGGNAIITQDLTIPAGGLFQTAGTVSVGGTVQVDPGATLEVQTGGFLRTGAWNNPGIDIVRAGGRAEIINDLTVGGPGAVDSFFDIFGEVTVGGTTMVNPGATLTVQPGGRFTTTVWRNPGKDIVRGIANITQDLTVGGVAGVDSFFDIFTEVTVGGTTTVNPGSTLTVYDGGRFTTRRWGNPGTDKVLAGGLATVTEDLTIPSGGLFQAAGSVSVGGTVQVDPGATLEVQPGGFLRTGWWRNPGTDIVRALGKAEIINDLTVGGSGVVGSFFDIFGEVTVGGTTNVLPGATLEVKPGGRLTTTIWKNPGRDIVRGIANITQDLIVGDPGTGVSSFFDIFTEVTVGGTTTVYPGGTLTVQPGGRFITRRWLNPAIDKILAGGVAIVNEDLTIPAPGTFEAGGALTVGGLTTIDAGGQLFASGAVQLGKLAGGGVYAITGGTTTFARKPQSWTANPEARQTIRALTLASGGGGGGRLDLMNNLLSVNYGMPPSPYSALAQAVNSGAITQGSGISNRTVGIYDNGSSVLVGYAAPGDSMMRGKVDSRDIGRILAAGKYGIGPSNARWDEGDFTHDTQVNSRDIGAILAAGVYGTGIYDLGSKLVISGPPAAGRATLIYDPATGDVKIDPNGNVMTGFDLYDSAGNFFVGAAAMPPGAAFITNDATEKFWSCFNPPNYLVATWDLGNIAPAGLTEAQFKAALNNAAGDTVWFKAGGGAFDYNLSYVPEPSSFVLLAVGALGLAGVLARRRWRKA